MTPDAPDASQRRVAGLRVAMREHRAALGRVAGWGAAAIAVVLLVALVAHNSEDLGSNDSGKRAEVGHIYGAFTTTDETSGESVSLRLPDATVRFTVTPGAPEGADNANDEVVRAPEDGRLVALSAASDDRPPVPLAHMTYATGDAVDTTVSLVADGHRYPLGAAKSASLLQGRSELVAVSGRPSHYGVAVEVDGVTQTADLDSGVVHKGRAAALYRTFSPAPKPCGDATLGGGFRVAPGAVAATCLIQVDEVPYVADKGWAPAGKVYLLVSVRYQRPTVVERTLRGHAVRYRILAYNSMMQATVDGAAATSAFVTGGATTGSERVVLGGHYLATVDAGAVAPHAVVLTDRLSVQAVDDVGDVSTDYEATSPLTWHASA